MIADVLEHNSVQNKPGSVVTRGRGRPSRDYDHDGYTVGPYTVEDIIMFNRQHDQSRRQHPAWWCPAPPGFDHNLETPDLNRIVQPWMVMMRDMMTCKLSTR